MSFLFSTKQKTVISSYAIQKTKHKDSFTETVPVFSRGDHSVVGVGFTFLSLQNLIDVQLPYALTPVVKSRHRNLGQFKKEMDILLDNGISKAAIARFLGVSTQAVHYVFNNPDNV